MIILSINPKEYPKGSDVIELPNKILLPGLMDMHTHLDIDFTGGFDHFITKENASKGAIRAAKNAEKTLMAGFTTVRDLGGSGVNIALRNAINKGIVEGPRIFTSGKAIGTTGGHADPTNGLNQKIICDAVV